MDGAAAALFAAGIVARTKAEIVWCMARPDLFMPALAQAGLHPKRGVFVEGDKEEDVLASMEEFLLYGGLGAVVGEVVRLPLTGSRRLQLAAKKTGTMAIAVRRWRRQTEANDFGQPTAASTRWRVSVLLSEDLPVAGIGRPPRTSNFWPARMPTRSTRPSHAVMKMRGRAAAFRMDR
ncbi:hypothetical protein QO004_003510 [Rhizobium mesoamericanum]|nr:hypothetical protein [Rhizobium mesoamericanum]